MILCDLILFLTAMPNGVEKKGLLCVIPPSTRQAVPLRYRPLPYPPNMMIHKPRQLFTLVLSLLFGGGMMWWLYRGFDADGLARIFTQRDGYVWITLSLLAGVAANVLRGLRWRQLLGAAKIRVTQRRAIELVFISYLVNSLTPRLGELVRAWLIRRGQPGVKARALGTVAVEKVADVGCLILLLAATACLRWADVESLFSRLAARLGGGHGSGTWWGILTAALLVVGFVYCARRRSLWTARGEGTDAARRTEGRKSLRALCLELWHGVCAIRTLDRPWTFCLLSFGVWACNYLQLYLLLPLYDGLGGVGGLDMLCVFAAASLGALLPTPSGAGPWHAAVIGMLTGVYGVGATVAKSYALVCHGLKTALVMLLGAAAYLSYYSALIMRRLRRGKIQKSRS